MDEQRYKNLMDRAMQCIHRAREINDRYPDNPVGITADEAQQRKSLLQEATRLRDLAETEKQQGELETWAQSPDSTHPALAAAAANGSKAAVHRDRPELSRPTKPLQRPHFATALRHASQSP